MIRRVAIIALLAAACAAYGQGWDVLGALWTEPMASAAWTPAQLSPVAWWRGDSTSVDSSGNGHNGSWVAGETYVSGVNGNALSFNGSNGTVSVTGSALLNITNAFSILFWIKSDNLAQTQKYLLFRGLPTNQSAVIYEFVNNNVEMYAVGYSGADPRTGSQLSVANTNWNHVAYVYNGSAYVGYVNTNAINFGARTFSLASTTTNWFIGSSGAANYFQGALDDVLIFNYALSVSNLQQIYTWRQ